MLGIFDFGVQVIGAEVGYKQEDELVDPRLVNMGDEIGAKSEQRFVYFQNL